jgi:hypothetical protein
MRRLQDAEPVYRFEDHELMGFICPDLDDNGCWVPLTVFGYPFDTSGSKEAVTLTVLEKGLSILTEKWEFYSPEEEEWSECLITEASTGYVTVHVISLGHPDYDKRRTIGNPTMDQIRLKK